MHTTSRGGLRLRLVVALAAIVISSANSEPQVNVTTWHNDIGRKGQNTSGPTLTQSAVTENKFGKLCSATLDGMVYSQPLVVTKVNFNGNGSKTVAPSTSGHGPSESIIGIS
jgi:hypothetical protein